MPLPPPPLPSPFGAHLSAYRRRAGLTQRQLADALGMHPTYLSKVEGGHLTPPDGDWIDRAVAALGLEQAESNLLWYLAGRVPPDVVSLLTTEPLAVRLCRAIAHVPAAQRAEEIGALLAVAHERLLWGRPAPSQGASAAAAPDAAPSDAAPAPPAAPDSAAATAPAVPATGNPLGALLRATRTAQGLGLRASAHRMGVSPAFLSTLERQPDRVPGVSEVTLRQMADVLGLDGDALCVIAHRTPAAVVPTRATEVALYRRIKAMPEAEQAQLLRTWSEG